MQQKLIKCFIFTSGILLAVTAIAKIISSLGSAEILLVSDPIFAISFQHIFWIAGVFEIAVASVCLFSQCVGLSAGLVAWLATGIMLYRLGLVFGGYYKLCPCLGNVTDALHIAPHTTDTVMKIVLIYLILGSYFTLYCLWWQKRKSDLP